MQTGETVLFSWCNRLMVFDSPNVKLISEGFRSVFNWPGMGGIVSKCLLSQCVLDFPASTTLTQAESFVQKSSKQRCRRLRLHALESRAGGICLVNRYGFLLMTSACKYEFTVRSVGLKARLCRITETDYHASQRKTTDRLKAGWMEREMLWRWRSCCCWYVTMSSHGF